MPTPWPTHHMNHNFTSARFHGLVNVFLICILIINILFMPTNYALGYVLVSINFYCLTNTEHQVDRRFVQFSIKRQISAEFLFYYYCSCQAVSESSLRWQLAA